MSPPSGTYQDYCGIAYAPGPLEITNVALWAFFLSADRPRLEALLKRVFDETTGQQVRCRPLIGAVMLLFSDLGCIRTRDPEYRHMGHVRESNASLWVPTVVEAGDKESLAMFLAIMWVSDPFAIAPGRELWGFNKHFGRPRLPEPLAPGPVFLDAYAWDFRPDECPRMQDGVLAVLPAGAQSEAEARPTSLAELVREYGPQLLAGESVVEPEGWPCHLISKLFRRSMPQLFLRQFRAPWGTTAADLQQVVVADAKPRDIVARPLGSHTVSIRSFESHPLCEDLGLEEEQSTRLGLAARLRFDVENGDVVWSRQEVGTR